MTYPRMSKIGRSLVALAFALAIGLTAGAAPPSASAQTPRPAPPDPSCDIRTTDRVVAVGDVHGAFDNFTAILRAAKMVDARDRWSGGRGVLVQTGDILDRGADSRKAIDLLRRLERDAQQAGGRVVSLLGNHEVMRIVDDFRYLSQGEIAAFKERDSEAYRDSILKISDERAAQRAKAEGREHDPAAFREQFLKELPLGMIEMRQAFGPEGDYGKWVRQRATVARINGVVFLHGGISPDTASLGCAGINAAVRKEMASLPASAEQRKSFISLGETGPLWYRGLALDPEETLATTLPAILDQMEARAIVVGHTTVLPGRIKTRAGGRVIQIDTGMLNGEFYEGGVPAALEMRGETLTAIYQDGRLMLGDLPRAPAPASR
ncbi:MAG TPA: metallophosphoesterase [Vicinamibacterales bacterium]|nr:metallophosphoesterase [Vicinamibacterales bacterium]